LRLLKSANNTGAPVTKLFLIFNGLNELDQLGFYYDLAGLLINGAQEGAHVACLIVPFPAHLTRYPLVGKYAEKPLQRFISDPSDLFRQYLRFMVETQWLISSIVSIGDYPVTSGIPLLEPHHEPDRSRCSTDVLAPAIYRAWQSIFEYSNRRGESAISQNDVLQSIAVLRDLIGWRAGTTRLTEDDIGTLIGQPQLHVIGYSLGGYLAQSVFFSWPYAIGSCTTLCSGGALTGLRPEKIIHEEEWRAITHGLKYDIESGMLEHRIAADDPSKPSSICGIPVSIFTSHFQTFTDIFLQEPYGTYRHRMSEFAPRLFFVVGGNDPIVPMRSVLETSPPEGINLIEIAKLSHFIATERGEWPNFWLPTIANIISSFSAHSEQLLSATTRSHLWDRETANAVGRDFRDIETLRAYAARFRRDVNPDRRLPRPLNSEEIQETILEFVKRLDSNGFLLVLRNQIPVTLMGPRVLHRRGTVPHYADQEINRYWAHLQLQREGMKREAGRVAVVVPGHLNKWFADRAPTLSFKHLPILEEFPEHQSRQHEIWNDFLADWETTGALHRFDARPTKVSGDGFLLESLIRDDTGHPASDFWILNCLPDVWISLSGKAVTELAGTGERPEILKALQNTMLRIYTADRKKDDKELTSNEKKARETLYGLLDYKDEQNESHLRILRISAAQSSPRYLGELIHSRSMAVDLLTHTVLALVRSTQCREKGDFGKGWDTAGVPGISEPAAHVVDASAFELVANGRQERPDASEVKTVLQFGPFLVTEIGHGAMAIVYESIKDNHVVAIKRMSEKALRDDDNRKRFAQEAKVSAGLNHPNIVKVYDHGEIDGVPFLVMERLYGEPLKASIDTHKRFSPREAARLAIQIAEALDYTHLSHVFHRDLKPGNIMLINGGRTAKVMDFGIAVTPDAERNTRPGMCVGTPEYMSPGRLVGDDATAQSDLYALGLILYEMLTGEYAESPRFRIANEHPRPSTKVAEIPRALDDIVATLLSREPSAGYNSARQLLADIKAFVGPEG
jgi:tRNA A-37 threonylcarbamoyl transferase component Bud32